MKTVWKSSDSDIGFFTRRRKMSFVRQGSFRNFLNKISRRAAYFCAARRFLLFFNRSERRFFPMPSAPPCIFRTCPKPTILPCSFPARFSQAWLLTFPAVSGIINKRFKNAFSGCGAVGSARRLGRRCRRFEPCHSDHLNQVRTFKLRMLRVTPDQSPEGVSLRGLLLSYSLFTLRLTCLWGFGSNK